MSAKKQVSVLVVRPGVDGPPRVVQRPVLKRWTHDSIDLGIDEDPIDACVCSTDNFNVHLTIGYDLDEEAGGATEERIGALAENVLSGTWTAIDVPSAVLPLGFVLKAAEVVRGAWAEVAFDGYVDACDRLDPPDSATDDAVADEVAKH